MANAIQIIEKSIRDIQNGQWICADLCDVNEESRKLMGCAVGLVAIHGGHTEKRMIEVKNKEGKWENIEFKFALYPYDDDNYDGNGGTRKKAVRAATFALALSIPKPESETDDARKRRLAMNKIYRAELATPFSHTAKATLYKASDKDVKDGYADAGEVKEYGYDPLSDAQNHVINYNDGVLGRANEGKPDAKAAAKWFTRALKILQKMENTSTEQAADLTADLKTALATA